MSKPDRTANWYKNSVKLTASELVTLTSVKDKHTLTIERATLSDQAEYSIKVDGKTSKADVKVIGEFFVLLK